MMIRYQFNHFIPKQKLIRLQMNTMSKNLWTQSSIKCNWRQISFQTKFQVILRKSKNLKPLIHQNEELIKFLTLKHNQWVKVLKLTHFVQKLNFYPRKLIEIELLTMIRIESVFSVVQLKIKVLINMKIQLVLRNLLSFHGKHVMKV